MTIAKYFRPDRFSYNGNHHRYDGDEKLQDLFFGAGISGFTAGIPGANIFESPAAFRIEITLPGIRKSNVKISLDNNVLSVRINQQENMEGKFTMREYDFTTGLRSFILPDSIDTEKINSKLENGILTIGLPKKENALPKGLRDIQIN